jgi:hypothetical protein
MWHTGTSGNPRIPRISAWVAQHATASTVFASTVFASTVFDGQEYPTDNSVPNGQHSA